MSVMEITIAPILSVTLMEHLVDIWVSVTNSGGSVGFSPPVSREIVLPTAVTLFNSFRNGQSILIIAEENSNIVGWATLELNYSALKNHWAWLKRLQVVPNLQRSGVGKKMIAEIKKYAWENLDLEQIHLTVRQGLGLEHYYLSLGFIEVGRIPRSIRLTNGEYRDEVYMISQRA